MVDDPRWDSIDALQHLFLDLPDAKTPVCVGADSTVTHSAHNASRGWLISLPIL